MKIAVIGAGGRSGKTFVYRALAAGHSINAGVHNNTDLPFHANLQIIKCDARDINQIKNLINGCDAVASFIGHVRKSDPLVQSKTITALNGAMNELGINRLISLTGTGVRFEGDKIGLIDRLMNLSIGLIDPKRINDGKNHVELLKNSNLSWTIIRVLKLTNSNKNKFKLSLNGPAKIFVSRNEVSLAALEVLENSSFIMQAPIISKK